MNVGPCLRDRSAFMNTESNRISRYETLLHPSNPYGRCKKKLQTPSLYGACSPKLFLQKIKILFGIQYQSPLYALWLTSLYPVPILLPLLLGTVNS